MRIYHVVPTVILSFAALSSAQNVEQRLKWASDTIDKNAVTHQFAPPARSSETKWQVTRIDGCSMEMKETEHREEPDSVVNSDGVFGLSEDKVVTWKFSLSNLLPQFVMADITGLPHLKIFADADAFHSKTEVESRVLRKDGSTASTSNWSAPGNAPDLWIYFDSPGADNKMLVKKLEGDLRDAVAQCSLPAKSR